MKREDWEQRLMETISSYENKPFAWGASDCSLFAADCVAAQRDDDPFAFLRGRYATKVGAARVLKKEGGKISAVMARTLKEVAPSFAKRGDVCLIEVEGEEAAGIVIGAEIIAMAETGTIRLPRSLILKAFSV